MAQLTMNTGNKDRGFGALGSCAAGVVELAHLVRHVAVTIAVLGLLAIGQHLPPKSWLAIVSATSSLPHDYYGLLV
ncbi:hypothetical protein E4U13_001387 [Claviceps humidiphila]|uniref:Uncharacterized protein n=1 Tax=Claviceps humidiphila TaxID=1294629 RepID=A0A9P7TV88_9HYPO|nr:hypothetical protein E4U13_001387 [Claviceps humidiphila]